MIVFVGIVSCSIILTALHVMDGLGQDLKKLKNNNGHKFHKSIFES